MEHRCMIGLSVSVTTTPSFYLSLSFPFKEKKNRIRTVGSSIKGLFLLPHLFLCFHLYFLFFWFSSLSRLFRVLWLFLCVLVMVHVDFPCVCVCDTPVLDHCKHLSCWLQAPFWASLHPPTPLRRSCLFFYVPPPVACWWENELRKKSIYLRSFGKPTSAAPSFSCCLFP
ncbi:hypothetical protein ABB37_05368 [Leptomonas pyrrhocoris]|uniref:Uncharacterized protein n=1 Tax=Leptomonas pyrrhocoris TaxID=157538 RepID=A0A0N0VEX3_LEPPY|nr:hypothetical protein ABB37_05368 [Leptomonas pyrrhocoris]KPA79552.1 hypothetical protein ABB37_05368 [Leptomonas pyrrhocoris]|eukprot:XP_015657991.1 hypothetical protein ABB37_05368 [Leptomonas pyrrhocoris]